MSAQEVAAMDRMHKKGEPPKDIIAKLVEARAKKGAAGPSPAAVYRFLALESYKRGAAEKRGRKSRLPKRLLQTANAARLKLIKEANNGWLVTCGVVHQETKRMLREKGLLGRGVRMPSEDWLKRQMRARTQVRALSLIHI